MRLTILPSALEDLRKGCRFYQIQGEGLGEYFLDSLFSDIDSLRLYAGIHPRHHGYLRLLSKRFPYAVYYRVHEKTEIIVWRILDMRRDPKQIEKALHKTGETETGKSL